MTRRLKSRYRKVRDLMDFDYTQKLDDQAFGFLKAFSASFYEGVALERPGAVPADEAKELDAARRRDAFGALSRVDGDLGDLVEAPPYRSPMAEERRRRRRDRKRAALKHWRGM